RAESSPLKYLLDGCGLSVREIESERRYLPPHVRVEILRRRLSVDARQHQRRQVNECFGNDPPGLRRKLGGKSPKKRLSQIRESVSMPRHCNALQEKMIEQETNIKRRIAVVDNFPIDDPDTVIGDEQIFRTVISMHQTDAALRGSRDQGP